MSNNIYVVIDGNDSYPIMAFKSLEQANEFVKQNNHIYYNELAVWEVKFDER